MLQKTFQSVHCDDIGHGKYLTNLVHAENYGFVDPVSHVIIALLFISVHYDEIGQ